MAKRKKKSKGTDMAAPMAMDSPPRISLSIEGAENGSIAHITGESGGKYTSKNLVGTNPNSVLRLATTHLRSMIGKVKGKKSGKKKLSFKKV